MSGAVSNWTRIDLRSAFEYEREIRRFQLRHLSGKEHEDLTQNGKKWSKMPERSKLCASRLSQLS